MRKKYEITVMLSQGLKTLCYQIIFTICLQNTVSAGVGTTSGVFLNEPIGARPSSMGGAFSAVSDDANSIYSNPAGYHYMPNSEITTMYNKMLMDTSISYIGYVQPLKKDGTISASFLMFYGGNIEINSLDGTSETKKASSDWAGSVGYGTNLDELFFVGGNFKIIRSTLVEQYSATAIAFDVGGLYRSIDSKFSCGIAVYNLGSGLKYLDTSESLPFSIKTGVGYKVLEDEINSVLTSADINFGIIDKTTKVNMGVEYWLLKTLAIRAGYNPSSWTVGIGLNAFGGILDYGYAPMLDETTHKISLSFKFGSQDRIMLAEKYEEKGMYERAQYIRNPEDYMYAKAKGLTEANTYEEKDSFAPIVKSFEPKRASPGSEISIYGDKFGGAQSVTFGEEEAEILNKDNNRLIVKVPNVKAGNVAISVKTDKGSSLDKTFSVMPLKSPMLEVSGITFKDENGDNILGAEETGRIMFTIKNQKGAGESFGIKVKPSLTSGKNDLKFDDEILIGNIGSG